MTTSAYYENQTQEEVVERLAKGYQYPNALNSESPAGIGYGVVATVWLMGGGPSAWMEFYFDSLTEVDYLWEEEPTKAVLYYQEPFNAPVSYQYSQDVAAALWLALQKE